MKTTNKLRFVERDCYIKNGESFKEPFKQRVLQQWWVPTCQEGCSEAIDFGLPTERWIKNVEEAGEWRDIPLEAEE